MPCQKALDDAATSGLLQQTPIHQLENHLVGMACIGHSHIYTCIHMRNEDLFVYIEVTRVAAPAGRVIPGKPNTTSAGVMQSFFNWSSLKYTGTMLWESELQQCFRSGRQALQVYKARYLELSSSMIHGITSANNGLNAAAFDHQFWKNYLKLIFRKMILTKKTDCWSV